MSALVLMIVALVLALAFLVLELSHRRHQPPFRAAEFTARQNAAAVALLAQQEAAARAQLQAAQLLKVPRGEVKLSKDQDLELRRWIDHRIDVLVKQHVEHWFENHLEVSDKSDA